MWPSTEIHEKIICDGFHLVAKDVSNIMDTWRLSLSKVETTSMLMLMLQGSCKRRERRAQENHMCKDIPDGALPKISLRTFSYRTSYYLIMCTLLYFAIHSILTFIISGQLIYQENLKTSRHILSFSIERVEASLDLIGKYPITNKESLVGKFLNLTNSKM